MLLFFDIFLFLTNNICGDNMQKIFELIDQNKLIEDYEYLMKNAETGFELKNTVDYVAKSLMEAGIEYTMCGRCGICAVLGSSTHAKTLLLRADMDALPMGDGAMHACGHHMHTAMLLAAARAIKQNEDMLSCRVKLMFQPAEEILSGAKDMIDSGILQNPKVDYAFMLHVATAANFDTGTFIFASDGEIAPSADYFNIEVRGKGSHGAQPSEGRDPITAGAHILCALQSINARELGVYEDATITVGMVSAGNAPNAIADSMIMKGTMRTFGEETREFVKARIGDISSSVAKALRTSAKAVYTHGCPAFINDSEFLCKVSGLAREFLGDEKVVMLPKGQRGGGSEDFAYVSTLVPTAMALLCAGRAEDGYEYPLHNPKVKFDKKALPYGSALMTYIAFNL